MNSTLSAATPWFIFESNPLFCWSKLRQLWTPNKSEFGRFPEANFLPLNTLLQTNACLLIVVCGCLCKGGHMSMDIQWGAYPTSKKSSKYFKAHLHRMSNKSTTLVNDCMRCLASLWTLEIWGLFLLAHFIILLCVKV